MRPELTIHMGMPKTGTKALQKSISAAREKLTASGILYPSQFCNPSGIAHHPLAIELHKSHSPDVSLIEQFEMFLGARAEPGIIVSSESFTNCVSRQSLARLTAFLERCAQHRRIRLVMALRRMDSFVESMYLQAIKAGEYNLDFKNWLHGRLEWTKELFSGISRLKQSSAVESFELVCYRPGAIESGILPALGLANQQELIGPIAKTNTRLGLKGHVFLRYLPEFERDMGFRFNRWFIVRSLETGKLAIPGEEFEYSVYRPDEQMAIHESSLKAARETGLDEYINFFADDVPVPRPRHELVREALGKADISALMDFQKAFGPKKHQAGARKSQPARAGSPMKAGASR